MFGRLRITSTLGRRGERLAARWLRRRGYRILGRNVRTGIGEADIVCLAPDRETLVIVEVKTREANRGGQPEPEASVGAAKRRKLRQVAGLIAKKPGLENRPVRIDVIGIDVPRRGSPEIRHHESAVRG